MNENGDTIHPSNDSYRFQPMETYANEVLANIIKDARETVHKNPHETSDNANESNVYQPSTQLEHSTGNGFHNENGFDNEDIQKKMTDVIHDIQARSPTDINTPRKSVTFNHVNGDQINETIVDPSTQTNPNENSVLSVDKSSPSSIRHDENASDIDDILGIRTQSTNGTVTLDDLTDQNQSKQENHEIDDNDGFFNTKVASVEGDQRSVSVMKQHVLDETAQFSTATPPRPSSVSSKHSVRATPDEASISGDEKRSNLSPSKLPDDVGNETDIANREVAIISRRPSRALSPLNRPRSPTPNDSRKMSTSNQLSVEQSQSPTKSVHDDQIHQSPSPSSEGQVKDHFESATSIVLPPSRRESASKSDQEQTQRPTSAVRMSTEQKQAETPLRRPSTSNTNQFLVTDEQSKLVTSGERLQIPTDDINSSPSLPMNTKSLFLINPLIASSPAQNEQNHSRPSSETKRKGSTASMVSNENVIEKDDVASKSRRESGLSQSAVTDMGQKPASRRESQVTEQTPQISSSHRTSTSHQQQDEVHSEIPLEATSHQRTLSHEQRSPSPTETTTIEPQSTSRKGSTASQQPIVDKRLSVAQESHLSDRQGSSITDEQKIASRRESITIEQSQKVSSRRESLTDVQKSTSRKGSTSSEQQINHKITSPTPASVPHPSRRESTDEEPKFGSRKSSITVEKQPESKRASTALPGPDSSRRESVADEGKNIGHRQSTTDTFQIPSAREVIGVERPSSSRRASIADEQKVSHRKESTTSLPQTASKRSSVGSQQQAVSTQESAIEKEQVPSRKGSNAAEIELSKRRGSSYDTQEISSRKNSTAAEGKIASRRESSAPEEKVFSRRDSQLTQEKVSSRRESLSSTEKASSRRESHHTQAEKASSRRESHISDQYNAHRRQSSFDQKSPSKPVSRKTSVAEQQQQHSSSRRESQQKASSNDGISAHGNIQLSSPRRSSNVHVSSSPESFHRYTLTKQEHQPTSTFANKDSRRSSLNTQDANHQQKRQPSHSTYKETPLSDADDYSHGTSTTQKQRHTPSTIDKEQKSSSTGNENGHRRSSLRRRSEQEQKRGSHVNTDETIITPIIMESSKNRQQNTKRISTDSSYDQTPKSKLPPVNSFSHEKPRRSETLSAHQIPVSGRSGAKRLSSSHATTASEDEQGGHWTKKVLVPSIHLTDDETVSTPREDQPRPQSPNVEQIAERNQMSTSTSAKTPSGTRKKRNDREKLDGSKRRDQHHPARRSTSVDSAAHIRLVDDKSLDSTSDNTTDFEQHKRRHIKPRKKDVQTNTEQVFDVERVPRSFFDDREFSSQRPLKATKPMSDHLHVARRHGSHQEQTLTSPDTVRDTDTPVVRRTTKQSKDSRQEKDPVHVNVTVVVKKFSGKSKDETTTATAETTVEQKPQQYFEHVQQPPEISTLTTENKEDIAERPKSNEEQQPRAVSSEQKQVEHHERHTQSDTEQIITETQKKRRRPKRISRTSQTYECVFRRIEREQQQDLRVTSDTEKNIQTRKSQLRPRKKSPRRHQPVYLSTESFRLEELLPKQFHQSRRNMSKSSSVARSLSPQGGKLLILRPTLPFHHTDAVNVQRVCLQYAIDLIPNENSSSTATSAHRNRSGGHKQPEQTNQLPMISASTTNPHMATTKSHAKEKSASYKSEDFTHPRKNGGAV